MTLLKSPYKGTDGDAVTHQVIGSHQLRVVPVDRLLPALEELQPSRLKIFRHRLRRQRRRATSQSLRRRVGFVELVAVDVERVEELAETEEKDFRGRSRVTNDVA